MKRYEPVKHTLAVAVCWGLFVGASVVSYANGDADENKKDDEIPKVDGQNLENNEENTDNLQDDTVSRIDEIVPAPEAIPEVHSEDAGQTNENIPAPEPEAGSESEDAGQTNDNTPAPEDVGTTSEDADQTKDLVQAPEAILSGDTGKTDNSNEITPDPVVLPDEQADSSENTAEAVQTTAAEVDASTVTIIINPTEDSKLDKTDAEASSSLTAEEEKRRLSIAILSDTHYVSEAQKEGHGQEHLDNTATTEMRMLEEIDSIINVSLEQVQERDPDCLLICGDLTSNGEYSGAVALAEKLNDLKKQDGMDDLGIYVVNGNHDINNSYAADMTEEQYEAATRVSPDNFKTVYKGLGYGEDDHWEGGYRNVYEPKSDDPSKAQNHGGLSYASEIAEGVTLVVMDTGIYSYEDLEKTRYGNAQKTAGYVSDGLLEWVVEQTKLAKEKGNLVLGMCHHSIMPHYSVGSSTTEAYMAEFVISNTKEVCNALADAGMSAVLTGHSHANDIAKYVTENGNVLYDIQTAALCAYPVAWRQVNIDITGSGKNAVYEFSIDTSFIDKEFDDVDTSGWKVTAGGQTKSFDDDFDGSMQDYSYEKSGLREESVEKFIDYFARETAYTITENKDGLEGYLKEKLKISGDESVGSYAEKQLTDVVKKQDKFSTSFSFMGTTLELTGNRESDGSQDKVIKYNLSLKYDQTEEKGVLEVDISSLAKGVENIIKAANDYINAEGWKDSNYRSSPIQTELTKVVSGALIKALQQPLDDEGKITGMQIALDAQQAFARGDEGKTQTPERAKYQELLRGEKFETAIKKSIWTSIYDMATSKSNYPILSGLFASKIVPEGKNTIAAITNMSADSSYLNLANTLFLSSLTSPQDLIKLYNNVISMSPGAMPAIYSKELANALADVQASFTQDTNIPEDSKWSFHTITLYTGTKKVNSTLTVEDCKAGGLYEPTRKDYEFSGWYTAPNGGELVEADSDFSNIFKLYAHWTYVGEDPKETPSEETPAVTESDSSSENTAQPAVEIAPSVRAQLESGKAISKELAGKLDSVKELTELTKVGETGLKAENLAAKAAERNLRVAKVEGNELVDLQGNIMTDSVFATVTCNLGINVDKMNYLYPSLLQTFDRIDMDYEIYFRYKGKLIRLYIPKGFKLSKYADKNGFIGLLYVKQLLTQ